jgi:FxsC-like protein
MEERIPVTETGRTKVAQALGAAEVFVPLYSPTYMNRPRPLNEQATFQRRLDLVGPDRAKGHVQPVLWVPLAPDSSAADAALPLGNGIPEYARNGLQAMGRLNYMHEKYNVVLERLARKIVDVAETAPIGRSPAPLVLDERQPRLTQTPFVIGVFAPTTSNLPRGRAPLSYGPAALDWRPFHAPPLDPVAAYTAEVAQRLGLGTRVVDMWRRPDGMGTNPGVLLIDPWILGVPDGRDRLRVAVDLLPEWATLFVVVDEKDPQFVDGGERYHAEVTTLLDGGQFRIVKYAQGVSAFVDLVPSIVTKARRRYLHQAPMPTSPPGSPSSPLPLRERRNPTRMKPEADR